MSSNYEVLLQKFNNFKKFVKENSKNPQVSLFEQYTEQQLLQYSSVLFHFDSQGKLKEIVDKTVQELGMDVKHTDLVNRYYRCFIDYLSLMMKENHPAVPQVKELTEEEMKKVQEKIEEIQKANKN